MTTPSERPGHEPDNRVLVSVPRWVAKTQDPGIRSVIVLAGLAILAFVMFGLAWHGGARTPYVPLQLPWLVSGGMTGLALLGMALGGWSIHLGRRQDAEHRAATEDLVREAVELAEEIRSGKLTLPGRRR